MNGLSTQPCVCRWCVPLCNQGVIFVIGTADPGFHILNLFGEDRKRTIKIFLCSFGLLEVHYPALLSVVLISAAPLSVT